MRYWAALIIPFFIMSCALEKETTDEVNGVFAFTTASVDIDSITNGTNTYKFPPVCIDFIQGDGTVKYTISSEGLYGSSNVDPVIRNSYLRFTRERLYFNDIPIEIDHPEDLKYNSRVTLEAVIEKSMIDAAEIADGTYRLEIEMVASEYNGNGHNTVLNNTFSDYFGEVTISSIGQGCK